MRLPVSLRAGVPSSMRTLTWLAPAITIERFRERALDRIGPGGIVRRFTCFNLTDKLELDDAVEEIVGKLARSATVALGLTKWLQHSGAQATLDAHLRNEAFAMELSSRSEDFRIGMKALVDKTDPEFTGR